MAQMVLALLQIDRAEPRNLEEMMDSAVVGQKVWQSEPTGRAKLAAALVRTAEPERLSLGFECYQPA